MLLPLDERSYYFVYIEKLIQIGVVELICY